MFTDQLEKMNIIMTFPAKLFAFRFIIESQKPTERQYKATRRPTSEKSFS